MTYPEQRTQNPTLLSIVEPSPLKILLVEDNLTNQKVALKQLQTLGYRAEVVSDGQKAVEAIIQSAYATYELVLMDCQMPVMDGYRATQAIRAWENRALEPRDRIIVIAMTASDLSQDRERAIAAGMDDFISKPVRRNDLAAVLRRWSHLILATQAETRHLPKPIRAELDKEEGDMANSEFFQPYRVIDHLDLEHLHLLSDNSPEFELELLQLFVDDCKEKLEQLRQAIAVQDLSQVEQAAHHIKGASANVGATVMKLAAQQLETRAHQKQLGMTDPLLHELGTSLHHIEGLIERNG